MRLRDIEKNLDQSYWDAFKRLAAIRDEQAAIRPQYRHYLDLEGDAKRYESQIRRIAGALRNAEPGQRVPLWEVLSAIIGETHEIQVIELEHIVRYLGFSTTRSAIESALKTHPKAFRIRMSGRNKFVSLKG